MLEIRDNFTRAEPVTGLELIKQELSYRLDRLSLYGADYSRAEWLEWVRDLSTEADNASELECDNDHVDEYTHDGCMDETAFASEVAECTRELKQTIERLMNQKSRQSKQTLLNTIDSLEVQLSDVRADFNLYKSRGHVAARLAEDWCFTPEEARERFKVIDGGAA